MRPGTKKALSAAGLFAGAWVAVRWFLPLAAPFVLGLALALAAEPVVGLLNRRGRLPRQVSAVIGVGAAVCLLSLVLLALCAAAVRQLGALSRVLPDWEAAVLDGFSRVKGWAAELTARAPRSLQPLLRSNAQALFSDGASLVEKGVGYLLGLAGNLLSHVPDSALGLGTGIVSAFLISAKLPAIRRWLIRRIPKERLERLSAAGHRVRGVLSGWLKAQLRLMGMTFVILLLGFVVLKIPFAPAWAAGICLVDAFPVLGTGTVLLPWSLLSLLQGDTARAVGIAGVYVIVTLTRSMLEPRLLGRHLGLDPLVTLMAMYAGYRLWGFAGMFLAPVLATVAVQVIPERRE